MKISEWIKTSREAKGLTPAQLAEAINCRVSSIKAWERGAREPSGVMAATLMLYFGMPDSLEIMGATLTMHRDTETGGAKISVDTSRSSEHARETWKKRHPNMSRGI